MYILYIILYKKIIPYKKYVIPYKRYVIPYKRYDFCDTELCIFPYIFNGLLDTFYDTFFIRKKNVYKPYQKRI